MNQTEPSNQKIKELYNTAIPGKYRNDYETGRWFVTDRLRLDYFMTRMAIKRHLEDVEFSSCLEFGPGSGAFTPLVYRLNPEARFDLLDISKEMKKQFTLEMRDRPNVNYMVGDIMSHQFSDRYDFFYSIRAIEYLEDKKAFLKKIFGLLNQEANGLIVTKNPLYGASERGDKSRWQHSGRLGTEKMKIILEEVGFGNISFYPVVARLPLVERLTTRLTEKYWRSVYKKEIKGEPSRFIESYLVKFSK